MKFDSLRFSPLLMTALFLLACHSKAPMRVSEEIIGTPCSTRFIELDTLFQQGILPGRESNLIKQRMYWMEGSLAGQPVDSPIDWALAVDSVLIPMRMRILEDGRSRWSGSRSFYAPVRRGVPVLEEIKLESHRWNLKGRAALVARLESDCWLAVPNEWVVLETRSAP